VENREEWDRLLLEPLPGAKPAKPTPAQIEQEGAEFMQFMGTMQG
jgi:hypothetical protein